MPVFGQEGNWWSLAQHHPSRELFRSLGHERAIFAEKLGSVRERMDQQARKHRCIECMQTEFETRNDSEIAATTTERPEQVRILLLAGPTHFAVGGDHICADQVID